MILYTTTSDKRNINKVLNKVKDVSNFKITGDILECIATDSYRLAKKTVKLNVEAESAVNIVIPGKNILELDKILTDEQDMEMDD